MKESFQIGFQHVRNEVLLILISSAVPEQVLFITTKLNSLNMLKSNQVNLRITSELDFLSIVH